MFYMIKINILDHAEVEKCSLVPKQLESNNFHIYSINAVENRQKKIATC